MTKMQQAVLGIVRDSPKGFATIEDIAFEAQTSPQAAGRVVSKLSEMGLVTRQRFTQEWEIWLVREEPDQSSSRQV